MTVLLVEDDADQLVVRAMLFQQHGWTVVEARDSQSAITAARTQAIDCAVVDLGLPRPSDGAEVVRQLKNECPAMPVYVLSGSPRAALPDLSAADAIFTKGLPLRQLLAKIRSVQAV